MKNKEEFVVKAKVKTTTKTMSQKGKASKEKGKRGELEAAKVLMEGIPDTYIRRSVQYAGRMASHGGGGLPDLIGLDRYHLEVKRTEKAQLSLWMEQVANDKLPGEIGVILHRKNAGRWMAILDIEDFCKLVNLAGIHKKK